LRDLTVEDNVRKRPLPVNDPQPSKKCQMSQLQI